MSNRFKFRVWDGHKIWFTENLWAALNDFGFAYIGANIINKEKPWEFNDENIIIQQFTGLLDKNGKEIYEGDIVKTDDEHITCALVATRESDKYRKYSNGEIKWWNEGFAICQSGVGATRISEYAACHCCPCGLEIIGNIYENV